MLIRDQLAKNEFMIDINQFYISGVRRSRGGRGAKLGDAGGLLI